MKVDIKEEDVRSNEAFDVPKKTAMDLEMLLLGVEANQQADRFHISRQESLRVGNGITEEHIFMDTKAKGTGVKYDANSDVRVEIWRRPDVKIKEERHENSPCGLQENDVIENNLTTAPDNSAITPATATSLNNLDTTPAVETRITVRPPEKAYETGRVLLCSNLGVMISNPDVLYWMFRRFGNVEKIKILHTLQSSAMIQMENSQMAQKVVFQQDYLKKIGFNVYVRHLRGVSEIYGNLMDAADGNKVRYRDYSRDGLIPHIGVYINVLNANLLAEYVKRIFGINSNTIGNNLPSNQYGGSCLWVSGIPEELASPDCLCNIFGNYGNVQKIKICYKKTDCAIVQMAKPHEAAICPRYLNLMKVRGKTMRVMVSNIPEIRGFPSASCKDYSDSKIHRFISPRFSEKLNERLARPTAVLFISSIPDGKLSQVKEHIVESGYTVKDIKQTGKASNKNISNLMMALVELASVEEAVMALSKLHNTMPETIGHKKGERGMCFSFTRSKL